MHQNIEMNMDCHDEKNIKIEDKAGVGSFTTALKTQKTECFSQDKATGVKFVDFRR